MANVTGYCSSQLGIILATMLQIFGPKTGVLRNACAHFLAVMKCEDEVWPASPRQGPMRARLALELPVKLEKCSKNALGLG